MGILTNIEEQAHIVVPVFFILLLYINNMPIDFNITNPLVQLIQHYVPLAPKASFKNILMIISFFIFMISFETEGWLNMKYIISFGLVLISSLIFYGILYREKNNIKNGELDGSLKGYINDIKMDDWKSALINGGVSTSMIIGILLLFWWSINHKGGDFTPMIISASIILCITVLYLKTDGTLGLFYAGKDILDEKWEQVGKLHWYEKLYIGFIIFLLIWTVIGPGSPEIHKKIYNNFKKKATVSAMTNGGDGSDGSSNWIKYINPYGTLARDTNHPALAILILLLFSYKFRYKGFIIFTILIIIWEIAYDNMNFVKNNRKISLLAMFISYLFLDAGLSGPSIQNKGNDVKDKDKSK